MQHSQRQYNKVVYCLWPILQTLLNTMLIKPQQKTCYIHTFTKYSDCRCPKGFTSRKCLVSFGPFPFFLQLWVFQPHPPPSLLLIKKGPRKETMLNTPPAHPVSVKQAAPEGQFCTAAVNLHSCMFTIHSSLCHTFPLSFSFCCMYMLYALPV